MGFIEKTLEFEQICNALRYVFAGGIYVPRGLIVRESVPRTSKHVLDLTDRPMQVLRLMILGLPNKLIGRRLEITENTVKKHVSAVYETLKVDSRVRAVIAAAELGIVLPSSTSDRQSS